MRVVFINPKGANNEDDYELPSNIAYLAAAVEKADFIGEIEVLDLDLLYFPVDEGTAQQFNEKFLKGRPDEASTIFALPIYTYCAKEAEKMCAIIRRFKKRAKIIVGGPHITLNGLGVLRDNSAIDFALAGEADFSFLELLKRLAHGEGLEGIDGLYYRENGVAKGNKFPERIENMASLPSQTDGFKYLDMKTIRGKVGYCSYIASRGCVFSCVFCSSANLWGHKLKYLPAKTVIAELGAIKQMGFDVVTFRDDFFTMNKPWMNEILPCLKELGLTWGCETRIDAVDEKTLLAMKESGCKNLRFGIETFNEKSFRILNKKIDPVLAVKNLELALKIGIEEVRSSFMVGIPGETKEDVLRTVAICRTLKPMRPRFRALTPYIKTRLYENMEEYGIRFVKEPHTLGYSQIETNTMSNTVINELLHGIYAEFRNPKESYYHNDFSMVLTDKKWKTKAYEVS